MSKETLSPLQPATGFSRGLVTKLLEMTEHGILKSPVFATATTDDLDKFVKAVGPDMRDQFVALLERRFQVHTGCYIVPVNYDAPNAVQAAIDANAFGYKYVYTDASNTDASNIPLGGTGETTEMVREVHFGKVMYNRDLPEALKKKGQEDGFANGYVFANPLTALLWALKNPDVQKNHPLGILFYIGEQLYYLCLSSDDDERSLDVGRNDPDDYWFGSVRFPVRAGSCSRRLSFGHWIPWSLVCPLVPRLLVPWKCVAFPRGFCFLKVLRRKALAKFFNFTFPQLPFVLIYF